MRIKFCKNPFGKPPHIEVIINSRIVLGDYDYVCIFINNDTNRKRMINAVDIMLSSIDEDLSFNNMTLARIDLCANIEFDNQPELELYMKLIKKCRIPNGYKREKFKADQTDYKNSLRASRNLDMFTIYNKPAQMKQQGLGTTEKNILRFELCLYRKGIYDLAKKGIKQ